MAPTVRSFSAEFEPLDLVDRFPEAYPGLLESAAAAAGRTGGRYDILPFASGEYLRLQPDGSISGPGAGEDGFLEALDRWWQELRMGDTAALAAGDTADPMPFSGGWLVYLGYELAAQIERCLMLPPSHDPVTALALRAPAAWLKDRSSGKAWLVAEEGYEHLLNEFERRIPGLGGTEPAADAAFCVEEEEPEKFLTAVRRALEYTAAGDVYQTNLSRQWQAHASRTIDPVQLYKRLRRSNPSPFAAILRHENFAIVSSSPERLASVRGALVCTRPIAGTRPRGVNDEDDRALLRSLLENEKERAEHVMLIDLERNDLGRICVGGSVHVDEYMGVESYAHVHHIVSNVRGELREGTSPADVIRALFPGGTITGCPKIRTMQVIAELEGAARGAYTGSIGYLNRDGSCDFNILIRTISTQGATLKFRAGAGIVADSVPALELAETRAKAKGLLQALKVRA